MVCWGKAMESDLPLSRATQVTTLEIGPALRKNTCGCDVVTSGRRCKEAFMCAETRQEFHAKLVPLETQTHDHVLLLTGAG